MSSGDPSRPVFLLVGEVLRPHGLKGELRVFVHSDIDQRFAAGRRLRLVSSTGSAREVEIAACRPDRRDLLVRLVGVDDRNQAEALRGAQFEVSSAESPELPAGNYYFHELIGCAGHDRRTGSLGVVEDVLEDGGGILLVFRRADETLLVPFADAFLGEVDTVGKKIELDLPDGLVETCSSKS